MFNFTESELKKFLNEEAFFKNKSTFCLGNTLEEAGKIFLKVIEEREKTNVGMADEENE